MPYSSDKDACSVHFIRTVVLKEIVLGEHNTLISFDKENEDELVRAAMYNSIQKQSSELTKAKKSLHQAEKGCVGYSTQPFIPIIKTS